MRERGGERRREEERRGEGSGEDSFLTDLLTFS